jgi:hypothetical protein
MIVEVCDVLLLSFTGSAYTSLHMGRPPERESGIPVLVAPGDAMQAATRCNMLLLARLVLARLAERYSRA